MRPLKKTDIEYVFIEQLANKKDDEIPSSQVKVIDVDVLVDAIKGLVNELDKIQDFELEDKNILEAQGIDRSIVKINEWLGEILK